MSRRSVIMLLLFVVGCGEALTLPLKDAPPPPTTEVVTTPPPTSSSGVDAGTDSTTDHAPDQVPAVTFLGSCAWAWSGISSCTYRAGHAVASFFQDRATGMVGVHNRIVPADGNLCEPQEMPALAEIRAVMVTGKRIEWAHANGKADADSGVTVNWTVLLRAQTTTDSVNALELEHHPMQLSDFALCWFNRVPQ